MAIDHILLWINLVNSCSQKEDRKTMENQLQPLQVPLGNFSAEMIKLGLMSTQLWCNGSTLGSLTYDTRFVHVSAN
jgi:hypothetical protein